MRVCSILLVIAVASSAFSLPPRPGDADSLASMERKLQRIERNGSSSHPHPMSTEFTEDEINAYFAGHKDDLPQGVQSVQFQTAPGVVTATARVDFDQVKSGHSSFNPLLDIFSKVHDVVAVAHAHAAGGLGYVQIDSVSLDGVSIPKFALQLFAEKYVQPRYPGLGLDSKFSLPDRIDNATVGAHEVTVTQK